MSGLTVTETPQREASRFLSLWSQLKVARREYVAFERCMDEIVLRVSNEILPAEGAAALATVPLIRALMRFGLVASMDRAQWCVLDRWLAELLDRVLDQGPLPEDLEAGLPGYCESFDASCPGIDTAVRGQLDRHLQSVVEASMPLVDEPRHAPGFEDAEMAMSATIGSDVPDLVQRLFRATAACLHPDREPDETLRLEKQGLMASLLAARKNGDVVVLLDFYQRYAATEGIETDFDEERLAQAFECQLRSLAGARDAYIYQSGLHLAAYQHFYHASGERSALAMSRHLGKIERSAREIARLAASLTSMSAFMFQLAARRDQLADTLPLAEWADDVLSRR